jgi:hypothetical protein
MVCILVPAPRARRLMVCSILCNDFAIKLIEEPFIAEADDRQAWAL